MNKDDHIIWSNNDLDYRDWCKEIDEVKKYQPDKEATFDVSDSAEYPLIDIDFPTPIVASEEEQTEKNTVIDYDDDLEL